MWQNYDNSDNETDDEVEQFEQNFKPTFVVIAIDTHPVMFRKKEDGSSPFKDSLLACHSLADSLLLTSNRQSWNQFAVLLAKEESPCLVEFRDNLIDTTKLLKTKASLTNKELAEEYQRKGEFDLAAFLLACKKVFHDIKSPFYKRTLIYITDDDEPVQDTTKKFTALNEIKTFSGNQIDFQVIPTSSDFNFSKFYNELFSLMDSPHLEEICEDEEGLIEKLTSVVVMTRTRRKMIFYPFKNDITRFINCHKLDFISASGLVNSKLTKDGKAVKTTVENSDEYANASYFFKCKEQGRDIIQFDSYEKNCITENTFPMGLTLLHVSKRATDTGYILGKPFLLQPKEKENIYFNKFWQCCAEKGRVLVCILKQKQSGKVRYIELIPFTINSSPMFLAKYIPFATEIVLPKKVDYAAFESNEKKKQAIWQMVDALTFDFNVKMFPDATYQKKKEYIKAKLLEEPMEKVSAVSFDNKTLDETLKESVDLINQNFVLVADRKRKTTTAAPRTKKAK